MTNKINYLHLAEICIKITMSGQVMALLDPETPKPMDAYHSFIDKSDSQAKFATQELNSRQSRQVYLLTYSQADESIFPTR